MARGFTLIELVVVMVLLALLALGTSRYLGTGARMFSDAAEREQILSAGRFAAERLVRELRQAAPNSVRIATAAPWHCLEFTPLLSSGLYQQAPIAPDSGSQLLLLHANWQANFVGLPFSIYPRQPADIYQQGGATILLSGALAPDSDANPGTHQFNLSNSHSFPAGSPEQRFFILADSPVSFCYNAISRELRRFGGYAFNAAQPLPPAGGGVLMAKQLAEVRFSQQAVSLTRNNVVNLLLRFASQSGDDLFFNYEVHLYNVP
ncbi:MAG: prepilin-type N-terminal cleavage/methylation domain-containing protein [Alishewanella aestuarii]